MSLFQISGETRTRKILLGLGATMVGLGLVMSLFDSDPGRTVEQSKERTARIHESLEPAFERIESAQDRQAFNQLIAQLDLSSAPDPHPVRHSGRGYELFVNTSGDFLVHFFDAIGYTAQQVNSETQATVPPVILLSIPPNWADDQTVNLKKSLFFRVVLPLVLLENRKVLEQRQVVENYRLQQLNRSPVPTALHENVRELAVHYELIDEENITPLEMNQIDALLKRIDIVPPSLALAQAAHESGYGTSRFAQNGNALFGQWDWSRDALRPENQRDGLGDYGIKVFEQPLDSVKAYVRNLNTHPAYADFRELRRELRSERSGNVTLNSKELAASLLAYSEQGVEYTQALQEMIDFNQLTLADQLQLNAGDPVYFD